jgi:MarR family transcriptional regulator, temperature-dependent positive regulator of motility
MERTEMAGHLIRRLQQQSTQVFQTRMQAARFDLTSVQFAALDAVGQLPGIDQATLSATIGFDRATIGGVIERLESKGLLSREISEVDRRAKVLHLTDNGVKLLAECRPTVEALQSEILTHLSDAERTAFTSLAKKVLGMP